MPTEAQIEAARAEFRRWWPEVSPSVGMMRACLEAAERAAWSTDMEAAPEQLREAVEAIAALPCAGCGSAPSVTSDWAECETSGCPFDGVTIRLTAWEAIHRTMAPIAGSPAPAQ